MTFYDIKLYCAKPIFWAKKQNGGQESFLSPCEMFNQVV